jgi:hypothetical protein
MRTLLAAVFAIAWVIGSTPVFARGAAHGFGGRGFGARGYVGATTRLAPPSPQAPLESRIPAPLAAPAPAPTINGPLSQPAFRGLTGIGE